MGGGENLSRSGGGGRGAWAQPCLSPQISSPSPLNPQGLRASPGPSPQTSLLYISWEEEGRMFGRGTGTLEWGLGC